jgi:hypothetical protein
MVSYELDLCILQAKSSSLLDSSRLYRSGNPFKRPCVLTAITSSRSELVEAIATYTTHGATPVPKNPGKKGKVAEVRAYKDTLRGITDEGKLAARLQDELLPKVEREEARVSRARKRVLAAAEQAALADSRMTRTRRVTKRVDYSAYDVGEDDEVSLRI